MKLIDQWWTVLLHSAVSRTSFLMGSIQGAIAVNALVALGVIGFVPYWLQLPAAIGVGALYYGPIIWARLTVQPKLQSKIEANKAQTDGR